MATTTKTGTKSISRKRAKKAPARRPRKKSALPKLRADENGAPVRDESWPEWKDAVINATGADDFDAAKKIIADIASTFFKNEGNSPKSFNQGLALLDGISPRDQLEGMLAAQMIGTYNLAMNFMKNAMLDKQTPAGIDINVNRANKLLRTFTAQMEALVRYRGKGRQKMTVEHVHVHEGGQAIVGDVHHKRED